MHENVQEVFVNKNDLEMILEVFKSQYRSVELNRAIDSGYDKLLLLGNFSEAGLCTVDQEVAMYEDSFKKENLFEERLIVRFHPASNENKNQKILSILNANSENLPIVLERSRVPIEILLSKSFKLQVFAYSFSAVSISYLFEYSSEIILTPHLVKKYFPLNMQTYVIENANLYTDYLRWVNENYTYHQQ